MFVIVRFSPPRLNFIFSFFSSVCEWLTNILKRENFVLELEWNEKEIFLPLSGRVYFVRKVLKMEDKFSILPLYTDCAWIQSHT